MRRPALLRAGSAHDQTLTFSPRLFRASVVWHTLQNPPTDLRLSWLAGQFYGVARIAMMIAPKQMQSALLSAIARNKDALAEDFVRFVLAGLDAIALAHRSEAK